MKILSNFDTEKAEKLLQEAIAENGKENVIFVRRYFVFIMMKVILPLLARLFLVAILLFAVYGWIQGTGGIFTFLRWSVWAVIIISGLYFLGRSLKKIIDYYMDFTIITPHSIACYNQSHLLKTSVETLDISKIKSIRVAQEGLLHSVFNYGSIVFFAEGDQSGLMGDITLQYITNPNNLRDKINDLVKDHVQSHQIAETAIQQVAEKVVEDNNIEDYITTPPPPEEFTKQVQDDVTHN